MRSLPANDTHDPDYRRLRYIRYADDFLLGFTGPKVQVHHIRAMKDLRKKGRAERPAWVEMMAQRRRKTLVVCASCHADIHAGRPLTQNVQAA